MNDGCELMMRLAREAGFQNVTRVDTAGHPAVFATLDAGAPRTVGLYFMYDVKQADHPGYVFTDQPLKLPAAHFGLGHGSGAHAPDEYLVIESAHPAVRGWDDAVRSYVDYLYELAVIEK
jgi:hypothetical protein